MGSIFQIQSTEPFCPSSGTLLPLLTALFTSPAAVHAFSLQQFIPHTLEVHRGTACDIQQRCTAGNVLPPLLKLATANSQAECVCPCAHKPIHCPKLHLLPTQYG